MGVIRRKHLDFNEESFMQARLKKEVLPIIIYPPTTNNLEIKCQILSAPEKIETDIVNKNMDIRNKVKRLVENTDIEIIENQGLTTYQKERAFIYGDHAYGHAVAVICISGEEPIPFGVISADINNKQLPVIVFIANNDKARKIYTDFYKFLEDTHIQINKHLKNVDSFHFKNANHVVIYEEESEEATKIELIKAIQQTHASYLKQPDKNRTVRMESVPPTSDQLVEKRDLFSKKIGFVHMATSLEEFKSYLDKDRPTISFFGMIFSPLTDKCEWAAELGNCNLIYGLDGADKDKLLKEQSVMYQFAYYAREGGCKVYGAIPFGQVIWSEKKDFSIGIESCYITPQLQERMDAFKQLSHLIIVGSTGTGTYEEIMDTLRTSPLTQIIIINDDGGNTPLVTFLHDNKSQYPNVTVANSRADFRVALDDFKFNFKNYDEQQKPVSVNSSALFRPLLASAKTESLQPPASVGLTRLT